MRWSQIIALLVALLSNNEAEAQAKLPTIGFMGQSTASAEALRATAFVQRLRELGWIEGQNVALEFRWAEGRSERSALAALRELGYVEGANLHIEYRSAD